MTNNRRSLAMSALVLAAFLGALVAVRVAAPAASSAQLPSSGAARTSFSGLLPAAEEPTLPGLDLISPTPGSVVQAPGPFDDRFQLENLVLDADGVHGSALVTSDVSDVLEFEALAGFYDADGHLIGTGRFVHHLDEERIAPEQDAGPPNELEDFTIVIAPNIRGEVVSAAVGVPVLVNE
jgi:hypothetical protein